jgi:hypothetical protein
MVFMNYTGYLWDPTFTDSWARLPSLLVVSVGSLIVGVLGYVLARRNTAAETEMVGLFD